MRISQDIYMSKQPKTSTSFKADEVEEFFKTRLKKMYQCPPDEDHAQIHLASSTFGYNPPVQPGQKVTVCPCCQLPINTVPLPMDIPTTPLTSYEARDQSFYMDSGASMFFTFIKALIVYLVIFFLISCCSPIYMSTKTNEYCEKFPDQCDSSWFIRYSPAKFKNTVFGYYFNSMNILNLTMVILSIIFFYMYRKYQYNVFGVLDMHNLTQDDFTIFVEDIPIDSDYTSGKGKVEALLKGFFEEKINKFINEVRNQVRTNLEHTSFRKLIKQHQRTPEDMQKVKSISLCFDLKQMMQLIEHRQELIQEHFNLQKQMKANNSLRISVAQQSSQDKIDEINEEYLRQCKEYLNDHHQKGSKNHFVGKAFVSFEFQHYRNYILHLYQLQPELFVIDGKRFNVSQAANPADVDFFNMKVESCERIKVFLAHIILIFPVLFLFLALTLVEKVTSAVSSDDFKAGISKGNNTMNYVVTILINLINSLLVYFLNYAFGKIINQLVCLERHETKTSHIVSIIKKTFPAVLLNSVFMYFLFNMLQGEQFLKSDGIVVQISGLMISSGLLSIGMNYLQIDARLKFFWRKYTQGYLNHDNLFQVHYNSINQLYEFDFADRYCFYLVQLYSLLFYSYVTPLCVPAMIVILTVHYWVDKYNLLKCSANTIPMNFAISRVILNIFEISLVFFTIGNYYFQVRLKQGFRLPNFIALLIAVSYAVIVLLCPAYVQDQLFGSQHRIEKKSYTEALELGAFKSTYWTENPATMFLPQSDVNRPDKIVNDSMLRKIAQLPDLMEWREKRQSHRFE